MCSWCSITQSPKRIVVSLSLSVYVYIDPLYSWLIRPGDLPLLARMNRNRGEGGVLSLSIATSWESLVCVCSTRSQCRRRCRRLSIERERRSCSSFPPISTSDWDAVERAFESSYSASTFFLFHNNKMGSLELRDCRLPFGLKQRRRCRRHPVYVGVVASWNILFIMLWNGGGRGQNPWDYSAQSSRCGGSL